MNIFYILHEAINKPFSSYLNSFTDNKIIWNIVTYFSDAPIFILPIFLLGYWIYFSCKKNPEKKHELLFIFYSTCIAIIVSLIIQQFVHLDRPEESLKIAGKLILKHIPDASFPSDHASVSAAFITSLFFYWYKKHAYIILPFMIIMLLSRIAGWVHWPLDIVAGILVGILGSFLVYKWKNLNIVVSVNNMILKFTSYFKL